MEANKLLDDMANVAYNFANAEIEVLGRDILRRKFIEIIGNMKQAAHKAIADKHKAYEEIKQERDQLKARLAAANKRIDNIARFCQRKCSHGSGRVYVSTLLERE